MQVELKVNDKRVQAEIPEEQLKETGLFEQLKKLGLIEERSQTGYERMKECNNEYYLVNAGDLVIGEDDNASFDQNCYDVGNYYSDEKIAENNAKADRLLRKLRQWQALNDEPVSKKDCDKEKWTISYNYCKDSSGHDIGLEPRWLLKIHNFGIVFFSTQEKVEEAIEVFRDELLWYFTEYVQRLDEVQND